MPELNQFNVSSVILRKRSYYNGRPILKVNSRQKINMLSMPNVGSTLKRKKTRK